jgi:hypothetical protein
MRDDRSSLPGYGEVHLRAQVRWAAGVSVPQRNAALGWLPLAAASLRMVVATTGLLSGAAVASARVNENAVAWCAGTGPRIDNTGTSISSGSPAILTPAIATWPACDSHAHGGGALPVSERNSAALVAPITAPVVSAQRAEFMAFATTSKQPALAGGPELSGQSTTTYSVHFGDCLSDIATSHNIADWQQLYVENRRGISNPDLIYPGQLLRLPATQAPQ